MRVHGVYVQTPYTLRGFADVKRFSPTAKVRPAANLIGPVVVVDEYGGWHEFMAVGVHALGRQCDREIAQAPVCYTRPPELHGRYHYLNVTLAV